MWPAALFLPSPSFLSPVTFSFFLLLPLLPLHLASSVSLPLPLSLHTSVSAHQLHEAALLVRQVRTLLLLHVPALPSACRLSTTARRALGVAAAQPAQVAPHTQVCGQQGRRASRANLQCGGLPRSCRRRPWRACWPEPSGEPPCTPHTSPRHSCSLTHTLWLLARAHCRHHSGQRWTAQFARQDKQLHSANARTALGAPRLRPRAPPLPPSDQHVQHWSLRESMGAGNGAGHAKQTQLRSRGPGACSAPTGMGGPWTTTHRVAAGAKLRSFESIMAASVV